MAGHLNDPSEEWGKVEGARFRSMLTHLTKCLRKADGARIWGPGIVALFWYMLNI